MAKSRFHLNSLTVVSGLILVYWGIVGAAPEVKVAYSYFEKGESEWVKLSAAANPENAGHEFGTREQDLAINLITQHTNREFQATGEREAEQDLQRSFITGRIEGEQVADVIVEIKPEIPVRLIIPKIELNAPITPTEVKLVEENGGTFQQWQVPDTFAAGWHESSARLGEIGNTVLNGHHNVYGEVFRRLVDLEIGDLVSVASNGHLYTYIITNKMILPERYQQLDVRMINAQWILPSGDERLTLITCWPYESNTHRLILVAKPIAREELSRDYE